MSISRNNDKYYVDKGYYIHHVENATPEKKHTHDFIEFTYTFHGVCTHIVDGREYSVSRGDLLFINYGSTHTIKSAIGCEYANILIKPDFVDESLKGKENAFSLLTLNNFKEFEQMINRDTPIIHFSKEERSQIEYLISISKKEQIERITGESLIIRSCMNIFLINVFRKMSLPMNSFFGIDDELLKFIKDNCGLNLKMQQIAAKCHYNSSYFSRLFKKITGYSFTEYLNDARLDYACRLLSETKMNIEDIVNTCGFSDRSKFFKDFSQKYGVTPKKFRSK